MNNGQCTTGCVSAPPTRSNTPPVPGGSTVVLERPYILEYGVAHMCTTQHATTQPPPPPTMAPPSDHQPPRPLARASFLLVPPRAHTLSSLHCTAAVAQHDRARPIRAPRRVHATVLSHRLLASSLPSRLRWPRLKPHLPSARRPGRRLRSARRPGRRLRKPREEAGPRPGRPRARQTRRPRHSGPDRSGTLASRPRSR